MQTIIIQMSEQSVGKYVSHAWRIVYKRTRAYWNPVLRFGGFERFYLAKLTFINLLCIFLARYDIDGK